MGKVLAPRPGLAPMDASYAKQVFSTDSTLRRAYSSGQTMYLPRVASRSRARFDEAREGLGKMFPLRSRASYTFHANPTLSHWYSVLM